MKNVIRVNFKQKRIEHTNGFWYNFRLVFITMILSLTGILYLSMCVSVFYSWFK